MRASKAGPSVTSSVCAFCGTVHSLLRVSTRMSCFICAPDIADQKPTWLPSMDPSTWRRTSPLYAGLAAAHFSSAARTAFGPPGM